MSSDDAFDNFTNMNTEEFRVPGDFLPCQYREWGSVVPCNSRERYIQFVQANSGKRFICANEHTEKIDGKEWLPHDEFGPDGLFPNILPWHYQPTDSQIKASRWGIPKEIRRRFERATHCSHCGASPYPVKSMNDTAALWEWITEYDSELLSKIHAALREYAGAELSDWFATIPTALSMLIIRRVRNSVIVVDHGVPRKIANAAWSLLSRPARRFLQRNFVFPLCKKCNGTKSSKLYDRVELITMFVQTYYDGSEAAARADQQRWVLLQSTLDTIFEQHKIA